MRRTVLLASGLLLAATGAAGASECKGVEFPQHLQVSGTALTLNGLGMRKATFLKVNVYVAALYVTSPSHDATALVNSNAPQELILHFVRNVSASDMRNAWHEGFERVAQEQMPALSARLAMLSGWMTDMKTGQRLTFVRLPGMGTQVSVDGAVKGTITGDDFSHVLISIWLGAEPPNAELKSGLLGGSCS